MNCQKFETVVNDIAREQMIDAGARAEALRHIDDCQNCADRLADERAITARLRELAESMKSAGAPARVEARLLAAFNEISRVQFPAPPVFARQKRRRYFAAAIAAGLLFMFGLSAVLWRQAPPPANQDSRAASVAEATNNLATTAASSTSVSSAPNVKKYVARAAVSRRKSATKREDPASAKPLGDNAANNEIATDFLPMTYGGAVNLQEGGQMVRVELPRLAMASFGLPVNMDRANEKVKADVLLGIDGLAHAIRFVR
jgi:hypothetical protein